MEREYKHLILAEAQNQISLKAKFSGANVLSKTFKIACKKSKHQKKPNQANNKSPKTTNQKKKKASNQAKQTPNQ